MRDTITMEESISSSRTTAFYGNSYYCIYHHHQQQQQPPPAFVAAAAATTWSDFEDADSGWTAYFLQLASDEEEEEDASAYKRAEKQQLRDVGGVLYGSGSGRGSAAGSTVSKPNKAKDNRKTKVLLLEKGVKKTRIVEEEDPLQDTASSPLVQLNINGGDPQARPNPYPFLLRT